MLKILYLIRHAKSGWDLPLDDFDRPLIQKGIDAIKTVADRAKIILPESYCIWSSPAKRARDTAIIFSKSIDFPIEEIIFKEELYTFEYRKLETIIRTCSNQIDTLILFGHNEAISIFVNKFGDKLIDHVPTSGLVAIEFETSNWAEIQKGKTQKIIFPKNLN